MSTLLFCVSVLVGICGWGFLLAGALTFNDAQNPSIRGLGWILLIDVFVSLGLFTMLYVIVRNWRRKPEARRLFYVGLSCLAVTVCLIELTYRL